MPYSPQASNQVFDFMTGKISSGEWKPGTKIATEEQLCAQLDVSRIAVRQALEKLSALGVLKRVQGSGTYVNGFDEASLMGLVYYPPTYETMLTVLEFRRMFDPYNAQLFIRHATEKEIQLLQENYAKMLLCENDMLTFRNCDNEFHDLIARGTHNTVIIQISSVLTELLCRHQSAQYQNVGPAHAIKWHRMILSAVSEGNEELANIYARIHIDNAINSLHKKMHMAFPASPSPEGIP